jgi:hypothetical protein
MRLLHVLKAFVFETHPAKLVLLILLLMLIKIGIWNFPALSTYRLIAQNPFVNPFPGGHYLMWSWLGPFLAWLVGAAGPVPFFLFHLACSLAFTALFIWLVFSRFSDRDARLALIIFTVLPVSGTAYFWVGYDSVTLLLVLLALAFPLGLVLPIVLGVLLGMQHFEQGFFAFSGLVFASVLSRHFFGEVLFPFRQAVLVLLGVLLGKVALLAIFYFNAMDVGTDRPDYLTRERRIPLSLSFFFYHWPYILWSVLSVGWLAAIKYADEGRRSLPFFVTLGGLMLMLPIAADQTRVLAVVSFPIVFVYLVTNRRFLASISDLQGAGLFTLWILVPWSWVWGGRPKWSVFPYDIARILHYLFGWFEIPSAIDYWPFRP